MRITWSPPMMMAPVMEAVKMRDQYDHQNQEDHQSGNAIEKFKNFLHDFKKWGSAVVDGGVDGGLIILFTEQNLNRNQN